ncbi:MAG: HAD-IIIA family hydrolase, partial [Armatimonadetes bacterium]|nr:HAD-IIIA family hydrolase [Armatimonadota bacterium]
MSKAVFLDRDGVLNFDRADFIHGPDELVMIPGAAAAVSRLCASGWRVLVATNQSGIGRGLFTLQDLQAINNKVEAVVEEYGGRIDRFYYCPHVPEDNCECRKPKPGMLLQAARDFGLDLSECFL